MAVAASPSVATDTPPAPRSAAARALLVLPDVLVAAVAGFGAPAMVLLLAGQFRAGLVLPLGLAGALAAATAAATSGGRAVPAGRHDPWLSLAAVGVALSWLVANVFFTAENVFAHRDPATYNLAARWLMSNPSLDISAQPAVFGSPPGADPQSAGFSAAVHGGLYAQGDHLLPALLAPIGWVFGTRAMLAGNVVFGAVALLALFALARRVAGAAFALVAMCALAVSVPMIFVSRDTYSEPLAMLLLIGGLSLLHRAISTRRTADFALAGFVAGTAATVRIDSYLALLALEVAATLLLAVAAPGSRRAAARQVAALLVPALVMAVVGWLDVTRLSSGYYRDERHQIIPMWYAALVVAGAGVACVAAAWWPPVRARLAAPRLWRWVAAGLGVLVVAAFVLLASRPLWLVGRGEPNLGLAATQRALGLAVQPERTYDEQTLSWQAMYYGWPTLVLAAAGYVLFVRRLVRDRDYPLVGVLVMGGVLSALYLWTAQVTPDQPWAIRRYVPVVIPVLLVAAAAALRALWRSGRWLPRGLAAAAAVVVLAVPGAVLAPVAGVREEVPQLAQVRAVCRALGPSAAVVLLDGTAQLSYQQTVRSYCEVPALGLVGAEPPQLAAVRAAVARHGRVLYALSTTPGPMPVAGGSPAPFSTVRTTRWPSVIDTPPTQAAIETVTVYLGSVRADGRVTPVTPGS